MPITGGVLVAGGAARCLYSATGMLRFLARLSGRRRHVRRNFGGAPGGATGGAVSQLSVEPSSSLSSSPLQPPLPPPLPPPPSSPSPSSSSSCCFTTSATTTLSTSLSSSNEANNNDNLENQLISDSIRDNKNNLDLNDIRLRQCYLRCRRNIHSVSCQDIIMDKLSTYTGKRLLNITSSSSTTTTATATATATTTTSTISTTMTTMEEVEDDSLSRIAGLRDVSTTKMISRIQQRRCLEETDNNITRVSSSNINRTSCMSNSISSSGNYASTSSTRLKNDENSGSTGVARYRRRRKIPSYFATLIILSYTLFGIAEACSSRSTPKPRPPTPTPRPNITFHMDSCPPDYAEWYCLNGATCFTVKIQESLLYNCLCANGFIGQRCEFKDLDGSYLPSRQRVMLETASIAGGATIAVFLVVIMCISAYINCKRKQKELRTSSTCVDTVDGPVRDPERRPFSNRKRPIMTFMAKNSNCTPGMCPSIEQTRMPGWNDYSQVELTRLASINEAKRSSQ